MTPYQRLQTETRTDLERFLSVPFARRLVREEPLPLAGYKDFLIQAYHRVKHTVPLLAFTLTAHPDENVRAALKEYINEEFGHQDWVLSDLRSLGVDTERVKAERPYVTTEALISSMYWQISKRNAWCMFGMIYVLEDMSVRIASKFAQMMQAQHRLGSESLVYLTTHGEVDIDHTQFLEQTLNNNVSEESDLADIVYTAKMVYRLWGEMWRDHSERHSL